MDLIEVTETQKMSREAAADRLRALADALARHNNVEFSRGGMRFVVKVPDEVELEVEVEITDEGGEVEVEIRW